MQIYIHAGMQKTGTTSYQRVLTTKDEIVLSPEQFSSLNETLEEAAGVVFFSGIESHRSSYSTLEFDALEPELQSQMMLGLKKPRGSLVSRLKRHLTMSRKQ